MSDRTHRPFGVEQEHFVFHSDGSFPSHSAIDAFYERLQQHGFHTRATDVNGRILSLQKGEPPDHLVICNDSSTHILEAAFPILDSISRFRSLYLETWDLIEAELRPLGLSLMRGGVIEPRPNVQWRPKETDPDGIRLARLLDRSPSVAPLYHRDFPAWFAATQVSLTVPDSEVYRLLPRYYAYEFLSPLAFSNSREFQGVRRHSVRPLAWLQNFPPDDPLVGFPSNIPADFAAYDSARATTAYRDYSFVSVRGGNRLEFRSTCSQDTVEDVIDLLQLRLAIDSALMESNLDLAIAQPRNLFLQAAETGTILESKSLDLLGRFLNRMKSGSFGSERLGRRIEKSLFVHS